jgi:hypothetical protein
MPTETLKLTVAEVASIQSLRSWLNDTNIQLSDGPNGLAYLLTADQTESLLEQLYQQVSLLEGMIDRCIQTQE